MENTQGTQLAEYSTKLRFNLEPDMRSDEAAKIILRFLLGVMQQTEDGVKQDVDPEYLHDFRVAVRRTRSALKQIKLVFPEQTTARFRQDFNFVGKLTNDLRDLDVYLLAEDNYKAMLPPQLGQEIDPLFDHFRQKRTVALDKTVAGLNSKEYAKIMLDWEHFLNQPPEDSLSASNAALPIIDLACERIHKKYRRIVTRGYGILAEPDDEKMHPLRVQCKELRYMMEFFASLFPKKKIKYLTKQLKMLQRNLGDFNDFRVQQAYLLNVANELPLADDPESRRVLLATGGLIDALHVKQELVRSQFTHTFTNFASPDNQKRFDKLFS